MSKHALHSLDVAVALSLVDAPDRSFAAMGADLGLSASTVHESVTRLLNSGLVRHDPDRERRLNRHAMLAFLEHGVRYAFPGVLGSPTRGVPTAHAGPVLRDDIVADEAIVWPLANGEHVGPALDPLLPKAARLTTVLPGLYAMLSAVDAVRVGRARERRLAMQYLTQRLRGPRRNDTPTAQT